MAVAITSADLASSGRSGDGIVMLMRLRLGPSRLVAGLVV
jgi:hypothetical protein